MSPSVSTVILAAGSSTRLGTPKQLLPFRGSTLIRHLAQVALASKSHDVVVIIGASANAVRNQLKDLRVTIQENKQWQEGLSSSIRFGLAGIPSKSDGVLLMLCDQPHVTTSLLDSMIDKSSEGSAVVACTYEDSIGVPALFSRVLFPELRQLSGDVGAKVVLQNHASEITTIPFPEGNIDIDTPQDLSLI